MQKKLIAVAVAGALSAPALALAQASTVQIYGKAVFEYGYVNQSNGKPNMDMMQGPGGSAIGIKGTEALGGGLSAWYQCESSADIRGDTAAGFCTRNSALGLKGGFGSVYVGKWDTPFKRVMLRGEVGTEDTGLLGISTITAGQSTGSLVAAGGTNRTLWQRRQHDMVSYDTPNMSGFQGHFGYSTANATATTNGSTSAKPRIWSVAGLYDNGPIALGLGYERHTGFGVVGGSTDDHAWAASGSYTFAGKVKVGGSYNRQNYDQGAGVSSEKKSWALGVDWNVSGPSNVFANYAKTDDISGTAGAPAIGLSVPPVAQGAVSGVPAVGSDTGAHIWQIGYQHKFSKRTDAKLAYVRLNNDANARYQLGGLTAGGVTPAQANGQTQDAWVLLMRHTF